MKLRKFASAALIAGSLASMAMPAIVGAQTSFSVEDIGGTLGLGTADLKETVINIIEWILGFMTLAAVVMIIYGGFIWLTAGGNEDNIDKAKRIITAAAIGMIIILLAWAIVIFVARTTANVTGL